MMLPPRSSRVMAPARWRAPWDDDGGEKGRAEWDAMPLSTSDLHWLDPTVGSGTHHRVVESNVPLLTVTSRASVSPAAQLGRGGVLPSVLRLAGWMAAGHPLSTSSHPDPVVWSRLVGDGRAPVIS